MLKTKAEGLVELAVAGGVSQPGYRCTNPDNNGRARVLPGIAGVLHHVHEPGFWLSWMNAKLLARLEN